MTRRLLVAFAIVMSVLAITAMPVTAANLAVASSHSTDTEFNNASITNMTVNGTGESATVELDISAVNENPVNDDGDGTAEGGRTIAGDLNDNTVQKTEFRVDPKHTGTVETLSLYTEGGIGSDYGFTVNIYAVNEGVDDVHGEGTLIKSNWDPDFTTGYQNITLDTTFDVQSGETWTIEFVTSGSDNDGNTDAISIGTDEDTLSGDWFTHHDGTLRSYAVNATLTSGGGDFPAEYVHTHAASETTQGFANITNLNNVTVTATWRGDSNGDGTYDTLLNETTGISSTGNQTFTWSQFSGDDVEVNITVESSGTREAFALASEGVQFQNSDPVLDNASMSPNGTALTTSTPTLSIDVNDTDFSTAQGDTVTAEFFVDGSSVGTDTVTANGTASLSTSITSGGDHTWHAEITDSYGSNTITSDTATVTVPATIYIRNETSPHELINNTVNVDVTVTGSNETVKQVTVTDGSLDMSGLDASETYILTLNSDEHHVTEAYVESIYEQSTVFMLHTSHASVSNTITVTDKTGRYSDNPTLEVQRVINTSTVPNMTNNGYEWVTIAGDRLGASGQYIRDFEQNARYRFIVKNEQGDTRALGEYTAELDGTINLEIGEIEFPVEAGDAYTWGATLTNNTAPGGTITFTYNDTADLTTEVNVVVRYRGNNTIRDTATFTSGPYGAVTYTLPITQNEVDNESFVLAWNATRNGTLVEGERNLQGKNPIQLPIDTKWSHVLYASITLLLAFTVGVGVSPGAGAVTVAGWSGVAWYLDLVPAELGAGAVILAFAIGAWTTLNEQGGGVRV